MTHIEQAIKEAVKGGWTPIKLGLKPTNIDDTYIHALVISQHPERIFLDPSFWQALGKARGWDKLDERHDCDEMGCSSIEHFTDDKWKMVWHRFIDHLADGKDAESFFATLV